MSDMSVAQRKVDKLHRPETLYQIQTGLPNQIYVFHDVVVRKIKPKFC